MNKFFIFAVVILTAVVFTSCRYKSEETPLNGELIKYTDKNDDGDILYGVKSVYGPTIIPATYKNIAMLGENIIALDDNGLWLYSPQGELWVEAAASFIFESGNDIVFQFQSGNIYRFSGEYLFIQDGNGESCEVFKNDEAILAAGRIIYLTADGENYFIALNLKDTARVFDETGKELFSFKKDNISKLPTAIWTDQSVERRITDQSIGMLKKAFCF